MVAWTPDEDARLRELVARHGTKDWVTVAASMPGRDNKACSNRWHQHLAPGINKDPFTKEEDDTIIHERTVNGKGWVEISEMLAGRTDRQVSNRWNNNLSKRVNSSGVTVAPVRRPRKQKTASNRAPHSTVGASSTTASLQPAIDALATDSEDERDEEADVIVPNFKGEESDDAEAIAPNFKAEEENDMMLAPAVQQDTSPASANVPMDEADDDADDWVPATEMEFTSEDEADLLLMRSQVAPPAPPARQADSEREQERQRFQHHMSLLTDQQACDMSVIASFVSNPDTDIDTSDLGADFLPENLPSLASMNIPGFDAGQHEATMNYLRGYLDQMDTIPPGPTSSLQQPDASYAPMNIDYDPHHNHHTALSAPMQYAHTAPMQLSAPMQPAPQQSYRDIRPVTDSWDPVLYDQHGVPELPSEGQMKQIFG